MAVFHKPGFKDDISKHFGCFGALSVSNYFLPVKREFCFTSYWFFYPFYPFFEKGIAYHPMIFLIVSSFG